MQGKATGDPQSMCLRRHLTVAAGLFWVAMWSVIDVSLLKICITRVIQIYSFPCEFIYSCVYTDHNALYQGCQHMQS